MFRSGAASAKSTKGNISDSDSDWDTTVDFPSPQAAAAGNDTAQDTGDEDFPVQPKPKTRSSLPDKGKEDKAGDGTPHTSKHKNNGLPSGRKNDKAPASASAVHLSPLTYDSDSRSGSPVAPFTGGFWDANKRNNNKNKHSPSPSPALKDHKNNRYEMSPTPKIPASMEGPIPRWDDSDAEQQTLEELRTTLKKEKTRELESEAARKKVQDGGDQSHHTDPGSLLEKQSQGGDDKHKEKNVQEAEQLSVTVPDHKTGLSVLPAHWLLKDNYNDNASPVGVDAPYRPLVIKAPDGKRFLYCFSEGSTSFYEVEEEDSDAVMPKVAEKVEGYIKRGWQEFFSVLRILLSVVVYLVVEGLTFITDHVARPLILGVLRTTGNGLVKPLLAGLFNLILQPAVIFSWNVVSSVRHVFQPLIDILGAVMTKCAVLVQAFRLVEVNLGNGYRQNQRVMALDGGANNNSEIV